MLWVFAQLYYTDENFNFIITSFWVKYVWGSTVFLKDYLRSMFNHTKVIWIPSSSKMGPYLLGWILIAYGYIYGSYLNLNCLIDFIDFRHGLLFHSMQSYSIKYHWSNWPISISKPLSFLYSHVVCLELLVQKWQYGYSEDFNGSQIPIIKSIFYPGKRPNCPSLWRVRCSFLTIPKLIHRALLNMQCSQILT